MKFDPELQQAVLIKRYKRFLADITLEGGKVITIHCPNTGSMLNCGGEGSRVWFSVSANPKRKYPHTFELVETADGSIACINTQRANQVVCEALLANSIPELAGYESVRREVPFGLERSRVDFLLECHGQDQRPCYVEVKSVTLATEPGHGQFPDAVSARGSRHLRELQRLAESGCRAVLFFCVQHTGIERVSPATLIDPAYAHALEEAIAAGVEVMAWKCRVSSREVSVCKPLPFTV